MLPPQKPTPFCEGALPKKERFWESGPWHYTDPWDANLPKTPGFISDFCSHLRGYETPTAFALWASIFFISSAIKREAWISWADEKLFANFYVIFVGPPGVVKKGTTISHGLKVFQECYTHIKNPAIRVLKGNEALKNGNGELSYNFRIIKNKATPEALVHKMDTRKKRPVEIGSTKRKPTSEVCIVVPELATLLGKKDYASTTTELLMDLYDPQDDWHNETIGRGSEHLRYLCTNFLGATTPRGLQQSIPAVATEDGFISRCIMVFQRRSARRFPMPIKAGLGIDELAKRLAWIAEHTLGEHTLDDGAQAVYNDWYGKWKDDLETSIEQPYASSRFDIQVLKLALVLKASRYDEGKVISRQDVTDAIRIMQRTAATYPAMFGEVRTDAFWMKLDKVERYLKQKKKASRKDILNGQRITASELDIIITHMLQASTIEIVRKDGATVDFSKRTGDEVYRYIAKKVTEDGT